jgi:hypothetical protein
LRALREREQHPQPLVFGAQALYFAQCLFVSAVQVGFGHGPDRSESTAATGQTNRLEGSLVTRSEARPTRPSRSVSGSKGNSRLAETWPQMWFSFGYHSGHGSW